MKYLIKNVTTGEETLCEKVVARGFYYYVSDDEIENYCFILAKHSMIPLWVDGIVIFPEMLDLPQWKKVIATTNPSLDLPMVIDEVGMAIKEYIVNINTQYWTEYDFKNGYNKAKETYQYTKEDMVEWFNWCEKYKGELNNWKVDNIKGADLFDTDQLFKEWQEQRTITINVK